MYPVPKIETIKLTKYEENCNGSYGALHFRQLILLLW